MSQNDHCIAVLAFVGRSDSRILSLDVDTATKLYNRKFNEQHLKTCELLIYDGVIFGELVAAVLAWLTRHKAIVIEIDADVALHIKTSIATGAGSRSIDLSLDTIDMMSECGVRLLHSYAVARSSP